MGSLVDTLPNFVQKCNDFMKKAQEINAKFVPYVSNKLQCC